jgi:NitT/TauT family transport system substrate-binding protein
MIRRREFLRRGVGVAASLTASPLLAACVPQTAVSQPTPLPPPETTTIRLTCIACDAPVMAAERYLREEGFTSVEITDAATAVALADGKADMGPIFAPILANALQDGRRLVGLGGIHAGCAEIWAPQSVASMKDLRGRKVVVTSRATDNVGYVYLTVALKQAGVDAKDVNFVVQQGADLVRMYNEGQNDAVFVAQAGAVALKNNPANKGHIIHNQVMDEPWSRHDCCVLVATQDWYRANPVAAKRAVRAIYRAADSLPADRAEVAKLGTDKGLFGGAANLANVRGAMNMVPFNWRELDLDKSLRFYGTLMADSGLIRIGADELVKSVDTRIVSELRTEIRR